MIEIKKALKIIFTPQYCGMLFGYIMAFVVFSFVSSNWNHFFPSVSGIFIGLIIIIFTTAIFSKNDKTSKKERRN